MRGNWGIWGKFSLAGKIGQNKTSTHFRRWVLGLMLVLAIPFIINAVIAREGNLRVAATPQEVPPAYTGIILGAMVYQSGNVSAVLRDRLDSGVELYQAHKVEKLLLTGDHGQTSYDEVNAMREYVISKGVPPEDVFMDHAGFSTYDSMYRAKDVFGVKDAVIVTQQFHLARALYIARNLGLNVTGYKADKQAYAGIDYMETREFFARSKAFLQLHILQSKPKYLGPAIPINGDGRGTRDKV